MTSAEPIASVAIRPMTRGQQERLGIVLMTMASEDSSFRVYTDPDTGETVLSGMGELHLEALTTRLLREVGGDLQVGEAQVLYRETVRTTAEGEYEFARRTGGRAHHGHVVIRVERFKYVPVFKFFNAVHNAYVPAEFVSSVGKGVLEAAQTGIVAGFPVLGVKVTLIGGSHRPGESSQLAFKIAGSMAFKQVARRAQPFLLEPVISVEVVVPEAVVGDVVGDLSARYGRIQGLENTNNAVVIGAHVCLARMLGYKADLSSMTQGQGTYTEQFASWTEVDPRPDPDGTEPFSKAMRAA